MIKGGREREKEREEVRGRDRERKIIMKSTNPFPMTP
jgi:hypothetical protein